jgi:hypothetical protein
MSQWWGGMKFCRRIPSQAPEHAYQQLITYQGSSSASPSAIACAILLHFVQRSHCTHVSSISSAGTDPAPFSFTPAMFFTLETLHCYADAWTEFEQTCDNSLHRVAKSLP